MPSVLITGSADGLGQLAAQKLIEEGHEVVLHARNNRRAEDALTANPNAKSVLTGDLNNLAEVKELAAQVNNLSPFDAIIHNAGVYDAESEVITNVNVLAPFILTSLIDPPRRLIYLSSGMHRGGKVDFDKLRSKQISYSDSKLYINMLTMAAAKRWPDILVNAVDPGWVPTKMGGKNATGDLDKGYETQCWLATSEDAKASISGGYWYHQQQQEPHVDSLNEDFQKQFIRICEELTQVKWSLAG